MWYLQHYQILLYTMRIIGDESIIKAILIAHLNICLESENKTIQD